MSVSFKLAPGVTYWFGAAGEWDSVEGADDGAVEGEDALALEEVVEGEGGKAGGFGFEGEEGGGAHARWVGWGFGRGVVGMLRGALSFD